MNDKLTDDLISKELRDLEKLAVWMDSRFRIPGTPIRIGLDSVLGLLPGIGDTGTLMVTLYLTEKARRYNLPQRVRLIMFWNAFVDWLIGLIPLAGDLFDIGWKANLRNIALLRKHLERRSANGLPDDIDPEIFFEPTARTGSWKGGFENKE